MLRLALHLFHLESGAPGSDEIADGRRVSKKTELLYCQKEKNSSHHFTQRLGIQGYRRLDIEDTEEREAADHLAREDITWQFNLSRSPWWGGMYERLIKEVKKTLCKTLGRTTLSFEQLETVIIDIEKHLNNRPLTYLESDGGEEQVLTPNVLMWGQNAHRVEETEEDGDEVSKLHKRLRETKQHVWRRWKHEYVHSLLESHRVNRKEAPVPDVGEIVLVVGDERNLRKWKKGRVMRHIRGRDGVIRGVTLLHKGHHIERPLSLVCPLEIKGPVATEDGTLQLTPGIPQAEGSWSTRQTAETAMEKIRLIATDEDDD